MTDLRPPTDAPSSTFAYFTATIGTVEGKPKIVVVSTQNDRTHSNWMDPAVARNFAKHLVELADILDPPSLDYELKQTLGGGFTITDPRPPVVTPTAIKPKKRGRPFSKKRKVKRGKRA